jgi:hypothetical protein
MADASETAKALTAAWIGAGVPSKNVTEVVKFYGSAFTMSLSPRYGRGALSRSGPAV